MGCVSNLKTALQLMITEIPNVERISLVLGPSPLRPLHVYELSFSHGRVVSGDFNRSKVAEALSRKVVINSGSGICIFWNVKSLISCYFYSSSICFDRQFVQWYRWVLDQIHMLVTESSITSFCSKVVDIIICCGFVHDFWLIIRSLGPTKLFLLVKAPSYLNLPLHFLPKREFRQNKKVKHA